MEVRYKEKGRSGSYGCFEANVSLLGQKAFSSSPLAVNIILRREFILAPPQKI